MKSKSVTRTAAEHADWLRGLDFYRNEIGGLEQKLQVLARVGMDREMAGEVEHFQNRFIIQRNTIDELRHAIREHASRFGHAVSQAGGKTAGLEDEGHAHLKGGYESFEKGMNGLRQEFNRFLAGRA